MKNLTFSITLNNHTFNIRANHRTTGCSYVVEDKYTASLIFASNTRAHVEYKNIMFSGTVTKRNIWNIYLNMHPIFRKKYGTFYYETTKLTNNKVNNKSLNDTTINYPDNILYIYEQVINDLSRQYSCIENKEKIRHQLCEYLTYSYDDMENLDEIVECENYRVVGPDIEPMIETDTVRNIVLNDCKMFLISFHQAEIDNRNKRTILTLENVIKEVPELYKVPQKFLHKEFYAYLDENYDDLIIPDIYYCRKDVLYSIGMNIYESYQYFVFMNSIEEKIDKILFYIDISGLDKEEIYSVCKTRYSKGNIPSDEEFKQKTRNFIIEYVAFSHLYDKFVALFNTNHIQLEWNNTTIQLFQKYDKKELTVDSQHFAEYEVYKYIFPYYRKFFFRKNSDKYKPVIEQFSDFVSYATLVIDILLKYKVLIDNKELIIYNEDGDIDSAYKEIEKISIL